MDITQADFLRPLTQQASRTGLWLRAMQSMPARHMAEIGVWKGDFAQEILAQRPDIERYYMVDPWARLPDWNKPFNVAPEAFEAVYAEAMAKTAFARDRTVVLRGRTMEVLDRIPDRSLDFAYVDGDHTLRGITIDLIRLLPKMKPGGVIGGDDLSNDPWQHDARFEPTLVCPFAIYFAEAIGLPFVALPMNQFMIQIAPQKGFSFTDTTGQYRDLSLNKAPPTLHRVAA